MIGFIAILIVALICAIIMLIIAYYEKKTEVLKLKNERQKDHIKTMQEAINRRNHEIVTLRMRVNSSVVDLIAWSEQKWTENIALHGDLIDAVRYTEELEELIKELEAKPNE